MRIRHRTTAGRFGGQHGSATVETALAAVAFFMMLLPTIDMGRGLYTLVTLQHAVSETARFASTGSSIENPGTPGTYMSREDSIRHMLQEYAGGMDLSAATIDVKSKPMGGVAGTGPGGPGDVVTIAVSLDLELFTPVLRDAFTDGTYSIRASAAMANEDFPAGA